MARSMAGTIPQVGHVNLGEHNDVFARQSNKLVIYHFAHIY